jgi:hypothetical protein
LQQRREAAELRAEAEALLAEIGPGAGWYIGRAARMPQTSSEDRAALLALGAEIERIGGTGGSFRRTIQSWRTPDERARINWEKAPADLRRPAMPIHHLLMVIGLGGGFWAAVGYSLFG